MKKSTWLHRAAIVCSDALSRAIQGVLRAWWIAPMLFGYARSVQENADLVTIVRLTLIPPEGSFWLALQYMITAGVPILFILTLLRANHPVIVCIVSVALTALYLWKTMPMLDVSGIGLSFVVAVVSFVAAVAARSDVPLDFSWLVRRRRP